jgi:hypothetical protein
MRIAAHGIALDLPRSWEGHLYSLPGGDPVLHAASFPLPTADGDFGSGATANLPPHGAFLALKEYRSGPRLVPGVGLFASRSIPLPLPERGFHPRALQVTRAGQAGLQYFFTAAGRPFCLYVVIATGRAAPACAAQAPDRVTELSRILSTLEIEQRL